MFFDSPESNFGGPRVTGLEAPMLLVACKCLHVDDSHWIVSVGWYSVVSICVLASIWASKDGQYSWTTWAFLHDSSTWAIYMSHTNPYDDFNERKNSKSSLIYVHLLSCGLQSLQLQEVFMRRESPMRIADLKHLSPDKPRWRASSLSEYLR